jgi:hypothetical protein
MLARLGYDPEVAGAPSAATILLLSLLAPLAVERDPSAATPGVDLARRIDAISHRLLGAPYQLGPLGEEAPPDADPRFRLDVFDCTTYIETVLALALAGEDDEAAARQRLDRIRYHDGVPRFAARRHLIDAQWIPQLEHDGVVRDVTRRIGGGAARTATLHLERAQWQKTDLAKQGLAWSAVPHGAQRLDYLPWDAIARDDVRAALPRVAILDVIANPTTAAPTLVIHQALLFRTDDGGWVARNASSSRGRVVEEPLDAFLHRFQVRRRAVLGVNVLAIVGADG